MTNTQYKEKYSPLTRSRMTNIRISQLIDTGQLIYQNAKYTQVANILKLIIYYYNDHNIVSSQPAQPSPALLLMNFCHCLLLRHYPFYIPETVPTISTSSRRLRIFFIMSHGKTPHLAVWGITMSKNLLFITHYHY